MNRKLCYVLGLGVALTLSSCGKKLDSSALITSV